MDFDFENFCRMNNIVIIYSNQLTNSIRGFCYYDGIEYNIVINSKLGSYQNKQTAIHEILHVIKNHFSCPKGYEKKCETEVDLIIKTLKDNIFDIAI